MIEVQKLEMDKLTDKRLFDFVITVPEVIDKENERVPDDEMEEALDRWLIADAPISVEHTNKIVGKGVRWWTGDYEGNKAYFGRGLINKESKVADDAWEKVKGGTYKDVSIGGAAFDPTTLKDGSTELRDLEILEVALCEEGMHPNADIVDVNEMAKGHPKWFAKGKVTTVSKPGRGSHSAKWDRCVEEVREEGKVQTPEVVCTAALGSESFNKDSEEFKLTKKLSGGNRMAKSKVKKEEMPQNEEEENETPEEENDAYKDEAMYPTREEFEALSAAVEELRGMVAPAEVVEEANKQDGGGEPSPDGTEDEEEIGSPSTSETDEGEEGQIDEDISNEPDVADSPITQKQLSTLTKQIAEIRKSVGVRKSKTPRPTMVGNRSKEVDAFRDIIKSKEPLNRQNLVAIARRNEEDQLAKVFGERR